MLQLEVLTATRNALLSVVAGLEDTLRLKGIEVNVRQDAQRSLIEPPPVIVAVVGVLRNEKAPMSPRAIHLALRHRGVVVNYSTLYKALLRESIKPKSPLVRQGGKYQLSREPANNDTGTER